MGMMKFNIPFFLSCNVARLLRIVLLLLVLMVSNGPMKGQIIGDSAVVVRNNWLKGEYALYETGSINLRIVGTDTVRSEGMAMTTCMTLMDIRPDGDRLFELRTSYDEAILTNTPEILVEMYKKLYSLSDLPQIFLTDSLGMVKDICNYDQIREKADSCLADIEVLLNDLPLPKEIMTPLKSKFENMIEVSLSKEELMKKATFFNYYGKEYELGYSSHKEKLPLPIYDNQEIDATIDFTCSLVEETADNPMVLLKTETLYDTDQLLQIVRQMLMATGLDAFPDLDNPEQPYMTLSRNDDCVIDLNTGTVMTISSLITTNLPDQKKISYTVTNLIDDPEAYEEE